MTSDRVQVTHDASLHMKVEALFGRVVKSCLHTGWGNADLTIAFLEQA
ncbi:hypothetical protein [Coleofasciculus sp. H7-2]